MKRKKRNSTGGLERNGEPSMGLPIDSTILVQREV